MIENWLVKVNVGDVKLFENALYNSITKTKDVTGTTSAKDLIQNKQNYGVVMSI